jgi:GNAT superfamily N-acetyltransferase
VAAKSIRACTDADLGDMFEIINDAASAYRGVIPADRWHEPYMPMAELRSEIADGVRFWGMSDDGRLVGVMGVQDKGEVCLIRHAYVRSAARQGGIGTALLRHLESLTDKPILIGTWAAARAAIERCRRKRRRACCAATGTSPSARWRLRWCWPAVVI